MREGHLGPSLRKKVTVMDVGEGGRGDGRGGRGREGAEGEGRGGGGDDVSEGGCKGKGRVRAYRRERGTVWGEIRKGK